jgi:hypothetical protein
MKNNIKISLLAVILVIGVVGCKKDKKDEPQPSEQLKNEVPEFFNEAKESDWGINQPEIKKLSSSQSRISKPTDLEFNPTRKGELWIVNEGTESTGGTTVRIPDISASQFEYDYRKDGNSWHFMALPTALAFSKNGDWATTTGILDANRQGGSFTGPALWSGDLSIYAKPSGGNGSHLDMLHGSPYSMGIASERDNIYWVFDGYNKHICRYDFGGDHGPGNADHDDGKIHRFANINVQKNGTTPSHLVMSEDRTTLYVVDGGNNRVLKVDVSSATRKRALSLTNEVLADHSEWNADFEVLLEDEFFNFCGITISGNRLFLSDNTTGNIKCINLETSKEIATIETGIEGITGITIFENRLYFVSYKENALYKIEPK